MAPAVCAAGVRFPIMSGFAWALTFNAVIGAQLGVFYYGYVIGGLAIFRGPVTSTRYTTRWQWGFSDGFRLPPGKMGPGRPDAH